ncbi:LysE family transporter [uncultured Ilyobacter sp.]|uniref:LysE family translocator n=1 Tax=uncultured Ilyobacter sp. TaxID=544433 RepID=UPI0029C769FE|nr:LysE family transporter [uncultured Ilyobacter sp.]
MRNLEIVLLKGMLTGFILSLPLGPIGIYCMEKTLVEGEKEGYFSALGMVSVDVVYGLLAYLFLNKIEVLILRYEPYLKFILGLCLVIMGYKKFKTHFEVKQLENEGEGIIRNFFTCFLVTLANPSTVFVFVAIFTTLGIVEDNAKFLPLKLGGGIFIGGASMWFIITYILYHWRKKIELSTLEKITKSCGLVLLFFGALTLLTLCYH